MKRVFFALLLALVTVSTNGKMRRKYELSYKGIQEFAASDTTPNGVLIEELSGVSKAPMDDYYYGLTDVLVESKPIYVFSVTVDENDDVVVTFGDALAMSDTPDVATTGMDSEGIAYITTIDGNDFVVISSEGFRRYNADTHLFVYELDGTEANYVEDLDFLPQLVLEENSGPQDNGGIESLGTDPSRQHLIYASEMPLLQDKCDACVRIVVNDIRVVDSKIELYIDYTLRYDVDSGREMEDLLVLNDALDVLLLENGYNSEGQRSNRIYFANLKKRGESDITDCDALYPASQRRNDDCASPPIDKTLLFDTADNEVLAALGEYLDLGALGLGPKLQNGNDLIFGVTDESAEVSTYFVFFELNTRGNNQRRGGY